MLLLRSTIQVPKHQNHPASADKLFLSVHQRGDTNTNPFLNCGYYVSLKRDWYKSYQSRNLLLFHAYNRNKRNRHRFQHHTALRSSLGGYIWQNLQPNTQTSRTYVTKSNTLSHQVPMKAARKELQRNSATYFPDRKRSLLDYSKHILP